MPNERAHIAFMAVPAHGHINPGLGLVAELTARGHRVTYAVTEDFVPQVAEVGATPVRYESTLPSAATQEQWPDEQAAAVLLFVEEMIAVRAQLATAYDQDRPDLIVYDIGALQAPVLAHQWGVPAICLSSTHVRFEGIEEVFGSQDTPELKAVHARADEFFAAQGVPMTFATMDPERCVVAIPRSFQYNGDSVADEYTFVGPMLTERSSQGAWEPSDERPVLLISMGSAYTDQLELYRSCLAAFGGLDWQVVLTIGKVVDPAELGEIPANVEVHRWVPQLNVLSHADVFITHAGMGGSMEGLYSGVPMIAIPQAADQFANAERIEQLGIGVRLPKEQATPEALRAALDQVCDDPELLARSRAIRQEIQEAGGARTAADVVEQVLSEWPA
ncbi:MGT family glycosyltransferase [Saccharopolyspora gloriosae]|uniref:MGT family glycosyltransferase n=2 Tax=Saccharopolyspora gloriosae TaxID=455344 RepID=A0A840NP24_9PSEU|nr:MGT family glycosyltransferase [Saccharopolyspora gloriosae]